MAEQGWIKLNRKILSWEWYTDANTMRVFLHLLLKANHADCRYQGVEVKRGQVITGRTELAAELKISERNVRTAMKHLKATGEVTSTKYPHFSLITIENYNRYQGEVTGTLTSTCPASDHKQEGKETPRTVRKYTVTDKGGRAWEAEIPECFRGQFPSLEAYRAFESGEEDY